MSSLRVTSLRGRTSGTSPSLPDGAVVTGVVTATTFSGALTGNVTGNATGLTGTPDIAVRNITGVAATFSGNVSIGGTLTYEDVTNIDSIGIITARSGVSIGDSIFHTGDTNTAIRFPAADTFTVETAGSERLRVNSSGFVGVNTDSPGRQLTVNGGASEGVIQITNNTSGGTGGNGFELLHFTSGETQLLNRENGAMRFDTNGTERLRINSSGASITGNLTSTGTISDSKGDVRTIPQNSKSTAYTLVAADAGKHVLNTADVTVPASVFAAGNAITIINGSGSNINITQGSGATIYYTADGTSGSRVLAARGMASMLFVNSTDCYISGAGLS